MDIRQLRYFVTVADLGSFSAASAKLRISQPSIGQQVRNLEEELGAPLLFRHSRGIEVTAAGRTLIDLARDILQRVDDATRVVRDQSAEPLGELRLGMTVSAAAPLAAPLVRELTAAYPKIELSIVEALIPYVERPLRAKDLIETLSCGRRCAHMSGLSVRRIWPLASMKSASRAAKQRHALEGALV